MGLRKEQEKGNDHCILGKPLNSLWWPVYVIVFVQVEVPSSNRVRKLFCGFESFLGPQKVHGYHRINSWDMCVTSRDSCYPIGCQILHVLAILYSSLQ